MIPVHMLGDSVVYSDSGSLIVCLPEFPSLAYLTPVINYDAILPLQFVSIWKQVYISKISILGVFSI